MGCERLKFINDFATLQKGVEPVNYPKDGATGEIGSATFPERLRETFALFSRQSLKNLPCPVVSTTVYRPLHPPRLPSPSPPIVIGDAGERIVLRHNNNCANDRARKALRNRWAEPLRSPL